MDEIEIILIALLVSVALLASAARAVNLPYPVVLVLGGILLGVLPGLPEARLNPDLVLVIFLPPLIYSSAFFTNLSDLRRDLRPISTLAIGLVLATTCTVAVAAHAVIDDMSWAVAFTLGAIVAPTDTVAVGAIVQRMGLPRRMREVLEGESLINDGTALVAYKVAVAAVATGSFSLADAGFHFIADAGGGVLIGLAAGYVIAEVRRRLDDPLVENTISLLTGYAAYVPAEQLGASGILAAVTVGVYMGFRSAGIVSPATRLQASMLWEVLVFLLNAILFVLIGLQLPLIVDGLGGYAAMTLVGWGLLVSGGVIITRLVWQHTIVFLIRAIDRRPHLVGQRTTWQMRTVSAWAGIRGAVSLAAALALPADFPQRDLVIFLTFCVIAVTLVGQGLTLPYVIRRLGVSDGGRAEKEELKARLLATKAAIARIDELGGEDWTRDETIERMRALYEYRKRRLAARAGKVEDDGYEDRSVAYQTLVREVLEAQRAELQRLRAEGTISAEVMRRIERELDLEDQRLEI
ncbi:MAG: monovalent cation/hydrogen antiporter [bacterium]|jgi:CPA1 family monovalent cation:H+ antiporter